MLSYCDTFFLKGMIIYLPVIWFVSYMLISSAAESTTCSYVRITTNILLGMDLNLMARRTFFTSTHWFTWHLWKLCNTKCKVHFGNILDESCTTLRFLSLVGSQPKKRTYLNLKVWQEYNMWSFPRTDMVMNILQKKRKLGGATISNILKLHDTERILNTFCLFFLKMMLKMLKKLNSFSSQKLIT